MRLERYNDIKTAEDAAAVVEPYKTEEISFWKVCIREYGRNERILYKRNRV